MADNKNSITEEDEKRLREYVYNDDGNNKRRNILNISLWCLIALFLSFRCLILNLSLDKFQFFLILYLISGEFVIIKSYTRKLRYTLSCVGILTLINLVNLIGALLTILPSPYVIGFGLLCFTTLLFMMVLEQVNKVDTKPYVEVISRIVLILFCIIALLLLLLFIFTGEISELNLIFIGVLAVTLNYV